jgi:hypothetical protein
MACKNNIIVFPITVQILTIIVLFINLIKTVRKYKPNVWICLNISKEMYNDKNVLKKILGPCNKI